MYKYIYKMSKKINDYIDAFGKDELLADKGINYARADIQRGNFLVTIKNLAASFGNNNLQLT